MSMAIAMCLMWCLVQAAQPAPQVVALFVPVTVHLGHAFTSVVETPSRDSFRCTPFLVLGGEYAMRFTPQEPGIHTLTILSSPAVTRSFSVSTNPDDSQPTMGFLRIGPNHQHFIDSSSNSTVLLRGFNIAWPNPNPGLANVTKYYTQYFKQMQAVGANYARVWLAPNLMHAWNPLALLSDYKTIKLTVAAVVDDLLALAQTYGIRLMLVLESFNALCPAVANSECAYNQSVYSKQNGGPLAEVGGFLQFWSNTDMIAAWESYLKYVVARFAPHPSLFAIQLFNEVDACMFDVVEAAYSWHKHMAEVAHQADHYGHMVSESFGINIGNPVMDADSGFDITTTHAYARLDRGDSPNAGIAAANWTASKLKAYKKPSFVGEFGCDDDSGQVLTKWALHDGIWAPLFAGAAGTSAFWYWDSLPFAWWVSDLKALSVFLQALPFELGEKTWGPLVLKVLPGTVEMVGIASVDHSSFLLFLHSKNGSDPCVKPATQIIPSFELQLPASIVATTLTWYNSSSGLPLASVHSTALPATARGALSISTLEFISDVVLVGAA
jgi:hypothetical protein